MQPSSAFLAKSRVWIFPILTLDVVRPFFGLMGLDAGDPALLQLALRDATLVTRKRLSDALMANKVAPPELEDFYHSVAATLGATRTKRFEWWLQNIMHADPRDNLGLWRWTSALQWAHRKKKRWQRIAFPKEISAEGLARFVQSLDVRDFNQQADAISAQPLSDWDLHMYASQQFDFDEDTEGPGARPLDFALATLRDYRGYVFWAWVLRTLTPEQLEPLWQSARRFVEDEDRMSADELPHPSTLEIGL